MKFLNSRLCSHTTFEKCMFVLMCMFVWERQNERV